MIDELRFVLTFATAIGCGLVGGAFFAFSTFIMRALARLAPPSGIAAMQSINVVVVGPWFMGALFGSALGCLALVALSLGRLGEPDAIWTLGGAALYLVGSIVFTIAFNIPRNDALMKVAADSAEGAAFWARYVPEWTTWNTVRTVASLAAAVAFTVALVV